MKIDAYIYPKFGLVPSICFKILSGNDILMIIKGHNPVINLRKLTRKNANLEVVKVKAYAKFDQIPSIRSQDIERKRNSDNNQEP